MKLVGEEKLIILDLQKKNDDNVDKYHLCIRPTFNTLYLFYSLQGYYCLIWHLIMPDNFWEIDKSTRRHIFIQDDKYLIIDR